MKIHTWVFVIVLGATTSANLFSQSEIEIKGECNYPKTPTVINGRNATEEQMLANQKEIKEYVDAGNVFLECMHSEYNSDSEDTPVEVKDKVNDIHNSVVDSQTAVADLWKQALNAYNGKNKK